MRSKNPTEEMVRQQRSYSSVKAVRGSGLAWAYSLLRNLYAGQEATVRTGHGTTEWFQIGKGVRQAVYCHPAYLTSMQSTSCEMLGWMNHKLKLRLL